MFLKLNQPIKAIGQIYKEKIPALPETILITPVADKREPSQSKAKQIPSTAVSTQISVD
jgi:hypothetical protein